MSGSHRPCKRLVRSSVGWSVIVPSPHWGEPETGPIKKPRPDGGAFVIAGCGSLSARVDLGSPGGTFFRRQSCARTRDHARMMLAGDLNVHPRNTVRWARK